MLQRLLRLLGAREPRLGSRFWLDDAWLLQMRARQRAVGFVENLDEAGCERVEERIRRALGRDVQFVRRPAGERIDLVYGFARLFVEEAAEQLDRLESSTGHPVGAIRRIGQLLGYPECCVDAFCRPDRFRSEEFGWSYVEQRSARPGRIDPRLNPFTGLKLYHLPCRPDCPETLRQVERVSRALRRVSRRRWRSALALAEHPVAFSLRSFPQFAVLDGGAEVEPGLFRFHHAVGFGQHAVALERGNGIRVRGGTLSVLSGRREITRLAGEVGIWWHVRAIDPEWWLAEAARQRALHESAGREDCPLSRASADETPDRRLRRSRGTIG